MTLRLRDERGQHKGFHEFTLSEHRPTLWEGVFDTRRHVSRYKNSLRWPDADEPETEQQILDRLGVFVGDAMLGPEILTELTASQQRRSLLIKLPSATDDVLAAALARVPWEIARPAPDQPTLMERNVIVRAETADTATPDSAVLDAARKVAAGEILRALLVFAEAPGAAPLAMRRERRELLDLFAANILPKTRVEVDVLCHGVTRAALVRQILSRGGYHVVHWSGHGHYNRLQVLGDDGQAAYLTGEDFVQLFREAGGFIPHLVFLSACLSGTMIDITTWSQFQALLLGQEPDDKQAEAPALPEILDNPAGYAGTALALLRCGVPQVVAMRYEVGDAYARRLARQVLSALAGRPFRRAHRRRAGPGARRFAA